MCIHTGKKAVTNRYVNTIAKNECANLTAFKCDETRFECNFGRQLARKLSQLSI